MPSPNASLPASSSLELLLSPQLIEAQSFGAIYARGVAYEHDGNVTSVSVTPNSLFARVAGSHGTHYEVSLSTQLFGLNSQASLSSACTCLFAVSNLGSQSFCKHMVAAAIAGRRLYAIESENRALLGACAPGDTSGGSRRNRPRI